MRQMPTDLPLWHQILPLYAQACPADFPLGEGSAFSCGIAARIAHYLEVSPSMLPPHSWYHINSFILVLGQQFLRVAILSGLLDGTVFYT